MYPVTVFNPRKITKKEQKKLIRELKRYDLEWDNIEFSGSVSEKELRKLSAYCDEKGLRLKIGNALGRRRTDYRRKFFSWNSPDIGSRYICVYCGRLLKKDKVVVDHLYPVGTASKSIEYQKKLKRHGIKNINDSRNLVASCNSCNRRKGTKSGIWIFLGRIGRHRGIWFLRYLLRAVIIAFGAYSFWQLAEVILI
ncbi:MAG: HNH endonuclease [Eubacterium sp.]|nr:HNH endonuclease [Eubacterium sp.]